MISAFRTLLAAVFVLANFAIYLIGAATVVFCVVYDYQTRGKED